MGPGDKQRFGIAMGIMAEAFQKKPSQALTEIYWKVLQDLSIDEFEQAALKVINTRQITGTFPMVAEIREAALEVVPLDTRAALAWEQFLYALRHHCPYDSVAFDDPIISQIIRAWGDWPAMGDWQEDKTQWWRREFMTLYRAYAQAPDLPQVPVYWVGLIEHQNSRAGYLEFIPRLVMIARRSGQIKALPIANPCLNR